ncbi:hypothetical protein N9777_02750 [Ascidiaceihabitans sp.]|nr:hypothetical protein [Ascidiaceihabitans sp.]
MADTFGVSRPSSFLSIGPSARLLQTPHHLRGNERGMQMFTHASEFVDGVNVIEICLPPPVQMFHICLTPHAALTFGGMEMEMEMETYHPGSIVTREISSEMRDILSNVPAYCSHKRFWTASAPSRTRTGSDPRVLSVF